MSTPRLTREMLQQAIDLYESLGSEYKAAATLGIARSTFSSRLIEARKRLRVDIPDIPSDEIPTEEILDRLRRDHARKQAASQAQEWFQIRVREDKPYAILWFGDPHIGPNCDLPLLERHIEVARQDGIYGGNIGDTTDNWPWTGRMARLWSESDISQKTERQLAEWFMFEAGVTWLVWLMGNHDHWEGGSDFYKRLGANHVPIIDWRAKFILKHDDSATRIDAAHGRKGTSIYNPVHGTLRDAKFGEDAALYVTGHIHTFGLYQIEFPERRNVSWLMQLSGYKIGGQYEKMGGYAQSNYGSGGLSIIYPETGRVQCFADPVEGAAFLKWLRR